MKSVLTGLLFLLVQCTWAQSSQKPNVIIIYMDDMGYGDIEPFGMTGIHTPNFNRAAAEGLRLTNFNAAQAVCTASRAALLTGTYPNRIGMSGALLPESKIALNPEEETIASLLKRAGYATGILGKWHLGNRAPYFPLHYGFDMFYGIPYSHDIWPIDYKGHVINDTANMRSQWPPLPIIEGDKKTGEVMTLEAQSRWTTTLTEKAVQFIDQNKHHPFFLYLAHPLPHVPLAVSDRYAGKSELGKFGDVIMELDWSVGEILNVLDQDALSENTLLIITSDNGSWVHFGNHAGSSGGLREGKGTSFDGGTRVPCIMRWPGKIKSGSVTGELMVNMDILPTVCSLTGAPLPAKKIDGIDFSDFLLGKTTKSPRLVFYYYYNGNSLRAVRYKHWKLVLPHRSLSYEQGTLGKDGVPGKTVQSDVPLSLFDLSHDPGEEYDVSPLYPAVVEEMMSYVEKAREDMGDDLTARKGANRREPAKTP